MKKIKLTQGKVALVDDYDFTWLSKFKWQALKGHNTFYATRTVQKNKIKTMVLMHRAIMNACEGEMIDHKNRNGLDNQKHNLRFCTKSQNCCNKVLSNHGASKYRGVYYSKKMHKWNAYIRINKKLVYLGTFKTELETAIIWNIAARKYYGEFAIPNKFG